MKIKSMYQIYNSKTARCVGIYEPSRNKKEDTWFRNTLYCTKTGKYFLYNEGNSKSKYAVSNELVEATKGESINILRRDLAIEWAKENLDNTTFNSEFGNADIDKHKISVQVEITLDNFEKLSKLRLEDGDSIFHSVNCALEEYLNRVQRGKAERKAFEKSDFHHPCSSLSTYIDSDAYMDAEEHKKNRL